MADILFGVAAGAQKRLRDMGDGTHAEVTAVGGRAAGVGIVATAAFMPTAVSYAAGYIIDTAKQFSFFFEDGVTPVPTGSLIRILTAVIKVNAAAQIAGEGAYKAQAYAVTPPSARANNAVWTRPSGDLAAYRGSLALGTPVADGGTCYIKTQLSDQQDFNLTGNSLWLELLNAGTFTGAAIARELRLYGIVL